LRVLHHGCERTHHVNQTFLEWSGHTADEIVGKRFSDFLTVPGRIYYETHISPLLRMQGFFDEFAIDMLTAAGKPLRIIANANEQRDAQACPDSPRLDQGRGPAAL
jgi:sigma-B regulation protein RsbU (phosphoserine phosphatase)